MMYTIIRKQYWVNKLCFYIKENVIYIYIIKYYEKKYIPIYSI